jgi:hypothetical protein
MERVRIINNTTGEVRFVMPHIAENSKLLKQYGYVKQDFEKKEPVLSGTTTGTANISGAYFTEPVPPIEDLLIIDDQPLTEDQAKAKYFELFGKKAGNKKLETILSEIQEKLTIQ